LELAFWKWRTENSEGHVRMNDITLILEEMKSGEGRASEQLLPLVYEELRKLATVKRYWSFARA